MYAMLSPEQQALVRQGKIAEGMSPAAVMLAWGKPSSPPFQAQENGRTITRWYYMGYTPVTVMNNGFYAGGGPWGWYGGIYPSTSTAFVPKTEAYVEFENGKVTAWAKNMQN